VWWFDWQGWSIGIKLTMDPETGILTVRAVDDFAPEEARRFLRALYRGVANRSPPAMLWDLSGASLPASFDVRSFTSFVRRSRPPTPGCTAIVADQDATYGISRMSQAYLDDLPLEFQVFRYREDAINWLKHCCPAQDQDDPEPTRSR
jgi:hypothetical protein